MALNKLSSDFDMNMYTTRLDESKISEDKRRRAQQIADEIEEERARKEGRGGRPSGTASNGDTAAPSRAPRRPPPAAAATAPVGARGSAPEEKGNNPLAKAAPAPAPAPSRPSFSAAAPAAPAAAPAGASPAVIPSSAPSTYTAPAPAQAATPSEVPAPAPAPAPAPQQRPAPPASVPMFAGFPPPFAPPVIGGAPPRRVYAPSPNDAPPPPPVTGEMPHPPLSADALAHYLSRSDNAAMRAYVAHDMVLRTAMKNEMGQLTQRLQESDNARERLEAENHRLQAEKMAAEASLEAHRSSMGPGGAGAGAVEMERLREELLNAHEATRQREGKEMMLYQALEFEKMQAREAGMQFTMQQHGALMQVQELQTRISQYEAQLSDLIQTNSNLASRLGGNVEGSQPEGAQQQEAQAKNGGGRGKEGGGGGRQGGGRA